MIVEVLIFVAIVIVIVRNFRKDKSDGRDYLGGGRVGGGSGKNPVSRK